MALRLPKALSLLAGIVLLLLFVPGGLQPLAAQELDPGGVAIPPGQEFAPGQLLVRFHPGISAQQADRVLATQGASRIRRIRTLDVQVLRLPPGLSVERAAQIFSRMPEVEFAEPNYILRIQAPAAEVTDQWGLNQIQAPEAWAVIEAPNPDPDPALIAVVDTGIDRNHPDLADNIWTQPDGTWGWDFVNNDNDPFDDHMHGTMVSSVAAGVKDGSGVAGVCPWCQLMAVKVLDANGSGYLDTVATGITYAADMGADVINLSLGAGEGSQTLADAVDYAWGQGVLVVAAAGNDGTETLFYPAAYANAMAVASTNGYDQRSCFSNYGQGYISVAAPGEEVTGALPGGGQGAGSGTSLAAPHVSGLGGLLFSQDANRSNADVRSLIEATTNDLGPEGSDAYFGTGRINAYRAVTDNRNPTPPPGEGGISTSDADTSGYAHARKLARDGGNTVHLAWHGKSGGQYQVLYATSTNDGGDWTPPQVVFESSAETYHPALAVHGNYVYIAFPSMHDSAKYRVWFTRKALGDTAWDTPTAVIADSSSDAVRPDLYVDPANGRLHLVAATDVPQGDMLPQCRNDAPYVYYTWSGNGGDSWSDAVTVTAPTGAKCTRYADVHANNDNVYIASRSVEWTILNIVPHYRLFRVRSTDGGNTWIDRTELVGHDGWFTGEYGASLAGVEDQLYLSYEHNGAIYLQQSSPDGSTWSTAQNVGAGAWPSITQAGDGPWLLWTAGGNLMLRHYNGTGWEPAENLGGGNFPNLKLGTNGSRLEWVSTQSSCAPFRMTYDWRTLGDNNPPTANAGGPYAGAEDGLIAFDGSASSDPDGDSLNYTWNFGAGGTGTGISPSHAYASGGIFNVTLTVSDGRGGTDTDTTTATVTEINDPPVANDDSDTVTEGGSATTAVLDNDSDPDNANTELTVTVLSGPDNGAVTVNTDGSITYQHDGSETTTDGYTYQICDGGNLCDSATVTLGVTPVNDPPVANDDSDTVTEGGSTTTAVLNNDSDPDNANTELTITILSGPENGAVTINANGSITYEHDGSETTSDGYTYQICDGGGLCDNASVTLAITPVNDPPVASFTYSCTGLDCSFDASGSYDPEDANLSYTWNFGDDDTGSGMKPSHTYAAVGTYTAELTVTDDGGATGTASQDVTINATHIGNLEGVPNPLGNTNWQAWVTVTVHDQAETAVSGAVVQGTWSGGYTGSASCIYPTDTDGQCTIASGSIHKRFESVTFRVDDVVYSPYSYDATTNHDQDEDGIIVVYKDALPANQPPVASFTYSCTDLSCSFNASGSTDQDGTIASYAWNFGDGNPVSGVTASHTYAAAGTYTAELTVTDDGGATDTDTQSVSVGDGGGGTMHLGALAPSTSTRGSKWNATATITVHDASDKGLAGATVSGSWSDGATGGASCTTDTNGQCEVTKNNLKSNVPSVTFTVDNLTHATYTYASSANDTGTTITIPQ